LKTEMNDCNHQPTNERFEAPPRLVKALAKLPAPPVAVPAKVDEAVLRAARQHLRIVKELRDQQQRASWRAALARAVEVFRGKPKAGWRPLLPAAALAGLVLAGMLLWSHFQPVQMSSVRATVEDLNGDGQVDIRDALTLVLKTERRQAQNPALDLNGDGLVDRRDAEIIAAHAVSLDKKERL
jgi:hypothetical protein